MGNLALNTALALGDSLEVENTANVREVTRCVRLECAWAFYCAGCGRFYCAELENASEFFRQISEVKILSYYNSSKKTS